MRLESKLLFCNVSPARILAYAVSSVVGFSIMMFALQFYEDSKGIRNPDGGVLGREYLVLNKPVSSSGIWGDDDTGISQEEIDALRSQPWVRSAAPFVSNDYKVVASVDAPGGRGMSTLLFFEAVPGSFVDVGNGSWRFREGDGEVPVVIPKDYLSLYNFGFAGSAGLPRMSGAMLSSLPLKLILVSESGDRRKVLTGRIAGFSNRINTILVPMEFMEWSNRELGSGRSQTPNRLIVDVNSPGDSAIAPYLESHGLEVSNEKEGASAAFILKLVVGIMAGVGILVTVLSFALLLLSVSLVIEKNRARIHSLLQLGYPLKSVEKPYLWLVALSSAGSYLVSLLAVYAGRMAYLPQLDSAGVGGGSFLVAPVAVLGVAAFLLWVNAVCIAKKVKRAW